MRLDTSALDEKISDLVNRLPETPEYPFGNSQYASFMTPRDGEPWESKPSAPSNGEEVGLPPFLSPTLPPAFAISLPSALSPTLPSAFGYPKRPLDSQPQNPLDSNAVDSTDSVTPSHKKSLSINEYKKRKSAANTSPLTPTFPKTQPFLDSPQTNSPSVPQETSEATAFAEKSQRYLAKGTTLKREADKLSRTDATAAAIVATQAILYFMSAFACDDQSRKIKGKLQLHENWKSTAEFILWVINLQKEHRETELEGLCHQLHAVCHQRLYDNEMKFLRSCHKSFEKQGKPITPDDQFWKIWTESMVHYATISKEWRAGHTILSEKTLKEKFPHTWKARESWGQGQFQEGELDGSYRLPLGRESAISEAVGFAQTLLKELAEQRK